MRSELETYMSRLWELDRWRRVVERTRALLHNAEIIRSSDARGSISSLRTSSLYQSRREGGLTEERAPGLNETISSLREQDTQVLGGHVETSRGTVIYRYAAGMQPPYGMIALINAAIGTSGAE